MTQTTDRSPTGSAIVAGAPGEPPRPERAVTGATGSGVLLVFGLLVLGAAAGLAAIAYQRAQTRRCLAFYGADVARRVSSAPVVEVWWLEPAGEAGVLRAVERRDVSRAPGLVHLRRGLVEDANFRWSGAGEPRAERLPAGAWDVALVFSDPEHGTAEARLVVDLDDAGGGALAVVGRPGRIGLGRIGRGLATWIGDVREGRGKQPPNRASGRD